MTSIERQVMASVAVIYAARMLISVTALKLYVLVISLYGITAFVSVSHVMHNFEAVLQGGAPAVSVFLISAILSTTIIVQAALALCAVATISLVAPTVRSFATSRTLFA
jgi:hypothetical protein